MFGSTFAAGAVGGGGGGSLGATVEIAEIETLAKGTLIVGDGAGAPSTLAVGTDGQLLAANSATATGLEWQTFSLAAAGGWTDDGTTVRLTTSTDIVGIGVTAASTASKLQVHMASGAGNPQIYVSSLAPNITLGDNVDFASLVNKSFWAMASAAGQYVGGSAAGDTFIAGGNDIIIGAGLNLTTAGVKVSASNSAFSHLSGQFVVTPGAANITMLIKGAASQSGNLTEWQNSSAVILSRISSAGAGIWQATDTTTTCIIPVIAACTGANNTVIGSTTYALTSGTLNTLYGSTAGDSITTGTSNTCIGSTAGTAITTGGSNTLMGSRAGELISTGGEHVCIGEGAGRTMTTATANTYVGYQASQSSTGGSNVSIGRRAGFAMSSAANSTAVGANAGSGITTGANNTLVGSSAGSVITTGTSNVMIGRNTDGGGTIADNVCIGSSAGSNGGGTSWSKCVAIGSSAGAGTMTSNTYCILLGADVVPTSTTSANEFIAGASAGPINNVYFGKGATNATATAYTINGTGGSGADNAGANIVIAAGKGTGTGAGGNFIVQVAAATTTSSTLNSLATVKSIDQHGSLTHTGLANTVNLTASTERIGVNFNLSRTATFATGAITTQREFVIEAPTYAFAAASTITTAVTVSITGAPIAGTNATITNPVALRVAAGVTALMGDTGIGTTSPTVIASRTNLTVSHATLETYITLENRVGSPGNGVTAGCLQYNISGQDSGFTRIGEICCDTSGATANKRGGKMRFYVQADNSAGLVERMFLDQDGTLGVGTFTSLGAEILSGYITIKDVGGTTRKLAVIA